MMKVFLVLVLLAANCEAATYYACDSGTSCGAGWVTGSDSNNGLSKSAPKKTLVSAVAAMAGGDTLIIGDGLYQGDNNRINSYAQRIPSGSPSAYTTIQAEHTGAVVLDGQKARAPVIIRGNNTIDGVTGDSPECSYVVLKGVISKNSNDQGIAVAYTNHVKIIDCGAVDCADTNYAEINIIRSTYVLVEGCYAWGSGRYKIAAFHAHYTIFRNCVARMDRATAINDPIGSYSIYSSTSVEVQNCIDIDGADPGFMLGAQEFVGSFGSPNTSDVDAIYKVNGLGNPIRYTNVISLNSNSRYGTGDASTYRTNIYHVNSVGYNMHPQLNNGAVLGRGDFSMDRVMLMEIHPPPTTLYNNSHFQGWSGTGNVNIMTNCIVRNTYGGGMFQDWETADHNNFFNVGTLVYTGPTPTNTVTTDPLLNGYLYLLKPEIGSNLRTAGIGPTIIKQFGKSGTLFGEAGYNLPQDGTNGQANVNLWPWKNEDIIKTQMQSYTYTGDFCATPGANCTVTGTASITGDRGFASSTAKQLDGATPVTLTSYIWEALGSPIPSTIYNPPTTPPSTTASLTAGRYSTSQSVALSSTSDEIKYCIGENCDMQFTYSTPIKVLQNISKQVLRYRASDGINDEPIQELVFRKQKRK